MMKRKTAVIFGIIIAAQLCLTPYAGVKVQAAELEEGQMFEDSSEDSETFGDVSIPDTQSAEKTEENEFGDDDGFSDGDVETFSAEDADQSCENMQELVLNVQDGEDITVIHCWHRPGTRQRMKSSAKLSCRPEIIHLRELCICTAISIYMQRVPR